MAAQHLTALIASISLHALLVAMLFHQSIPTVVRPPLESTTTEMAIELIEQTGAPSPGPPAGRPPTTKQRTLHLGGNFLAQSIANRFHEPTEHQDTRSGLDESTHGWSAATQETNGMSVQKTLETLPFFISLHSRVNSALVYPDDFSRQRVTGRVRIEAELNQDGTLKRFLTSTTDDRLLQTYCFALLLQTLSRPLPPKAHLVKGESIVTSFDFEFHTRIVGAPRRNFATVIQKNHLGFGRENEVDPIVTERIREIFTHYVPPIVPLPGGVYIDFVMAYQFVQNIINDAPTERELRQSRIETLHEDLRRFVKNGSSPTPTATPES